MLVSLGESFVQADAWAHSLKATLLREVSLRWFHLEYGLGWNWPPVATTAIFLLFRNKFFPVSGGSGPDQPREEQREKNYACNRAA